MEEMKYNTNNKKEDLHNTDNYRGITLQDTSYQLYAMVIEQKLTTGAEEKKMLHDNQSGFRKGRETTDNIYIFKLCNTERNKSEKRKTIRTIC